MSRPTLLKLIQRNILLFSAFLFILATLLLFGLLMAQRNIQNQDYIQWIIVAQEVTKGLISASAVAFIYDWILKLENREQLTSVIRQEIEKITVSGIDLGPDTRQDYLLEATLSPIPAELPEDYRKYYHWVNFHIRFTGEYIGDEIIFVLAFDSKVLEKYKQDKHCLFRWRTDAPYIANPQHKLLDVSSLNVAGHKWLNPKYTGEANSITITFKRPRGSVIPDSRVVTYDFYLRTIQSSGPGAMQFYTNQRLIRPTYRLDARLLNAASIRADFNFAPTDVFQGPFSDDNMSSGTWQVFKNGVVDAGCNIIFTIRDRESRQL